jgi:hypothetical protein
MGGPYNKDGIRRKERNEAVPGEPGKMECIQP